jgi:hypothetical protein
LNARPKVIFHIGGHDFHPVYEQVKLLRAGLGDERFWAHPAESLAAFEHLAECDLLVFVGMYYSGWHGRYRAPGEVHKRALERYVSSGRPIIVVHGALGSYDDWPRFAELIGFSWSKRAPCFAPAGDYTMRVSSAIHAVTHGVKDYTVPDAPPCDIAIAPDVQASVLVRTNWLDREIPVIITAQGGRMGGAGKTAFFGHGHDLRSLSHPAVQKLWMNLVEWCLTGA